MTARKVKAKGKVTVEQATGFYMRHRKALDAGLAAAKGPGRTRLWNVLGISPSKAWALATCAPKSSVRWAQWLVSADPADERRVVYRSGEMVVVLGFTPALPMRGTPVYVVLAADGGPEVYEIGSVCRSLTSNATMFSSHVTIAARKHRHRWTRRGLTTLLGNGLQQLAHQEALMHGLPVRDAVDALQLVRPVPR